MIILREFLNHASKVYVLLPRALRPRGAACDDENILPSKSSVAASEAIRAGSSVIVHVVGIQWLS